MDIPTVSVVVPVYNGEDTIQACIESLLQSNYPRQDFEIIVINNASIDGTASILEQYQDVIIVLYESKRGAAAARNTGIKQAKGKYIALTDADCVVAPNWLKNIIAPLEEERIGIVGGQNSSKKPCNRIQDFGDIIHDHHKAINVYKPPYVTTINWASRLSVIQECNLFDENLLRGQDVDLAFRIFQAGYKLFYEPSAIVFHDNRKDFVGLFNEGFSHGLYSPVIQQKHQDFIQQVSGATPFSKSLGLFFKRIIRRMRGNIMTFFNENDKFNSICAIIFDCGKTTGEILGLFRFRYLRKDEKNFT